ncbi:MAG TPA: uroporphyrinogen-III synthase [Longimicrobiales bacterium]|nr:uroporphyrinogen-III synthase [Longimicrobiales bacterium]
MSDGGGMSEARGPLAGRTVAITRPADGADDLAERLRVVGAVPLVAPLVRIEAAGERELGAAALALASYDWVVFTSATAVQRLSSALPAGPGEGAPRVAAVGAATAAAVREMLGWDVAVVPAQFTGDAVVPAMLEAGSLAGARVLWPRAQDARTAIADALAAAGAHLDAPVAYRTVPDEAAAARLVQRIDGGTVDIVTFTSPSTVAAFASAVPPRESVTVAVIGPVTAAACAARGIAVQIVPAEHTIRALVDALCVYWTRVK